MESYKNNRGSPKTPESIAFWELLFLRVQKQQEGTTFNHLIFMLVKKIIHF
jgi:hypothetical protein